ncbi:hypothetical protein NE235_20630 [Actinoallomurus spadix]|uniref:Uncharacterized protein n=1 Tax=Actinoallomurus spadix TaxID=79912 RepID=A0ABP3G296_9ACTN|nr:hypothetical protein [Actinoallomurus spadix]MCO5988515.1 hypothetical protein [Actinoallomurus spadix]
MTSPAHVREGEGVRAGRARWPWPAFPTRTFHVHPARWSPLVCDFRHYFGLERRLGRTFRAEY